MNVLDSIIGKKEGKKIEELGGGEDGEVGNGRNQSWMKLVLIIIVANASSNVSRYKLVICKRNLQSPVM